MRSLSIIAAGFAGTGICLPQGASRPKGPSPTPTFSSFPIRQMGSISFNPSMAIFLTTLDPELGTHWGCTNRTGPNPLDCPACMTAWGNMPGGVVDVAYSSCDCWSWKSCQTCVCAIKKNISVNTTTVVNRLWKPCQIFCAVNNSSSIWQPEDGSFSIEMKGI